MKKIIFTAYIILILSGASYSQTDSGKTIRDGLYLIVRVDTIESKPDTLSSNEKAIFFSKMFEEFNNDEFTRIIIDTTEFVPLELEKPPVTEKETDQKKKLLLSLTKEVSEQLKTFTAKYLMRHVALVVDGEALTMHKIKVAITSGELQITRCNDNACEKLFVKLKDNVKK
jgi:hypothetical protein